MHQEVHEETDGYNNRNIGNGVDVDPAYLQSTQQVEVQHDNHGTNKTDRRPVWYDKKSHTTDRDYSQDGGQNQFVDGNRVLREDEQCVRKKTLAWLTTAPAKDVTYQLPVVVLKDAQEKQKQ